ncbi:MAG TPA: TM2 domain-containing protein [Firmicutes bacterium]|nr:TM2 domain-containing protein [Bacillota bacterium]
MDTLLAAKKDLSPQELSMLESEFRRRKKSRVVLWLLWWFTGILGGHRYYLGDKGRAIIHTVVFLLVLFISILWNAYVIDTATTVEEVIILGPAGMSLFIIPALWAIIDALFIGRRLNRKNEEIELDIINQIKNMRSTTVLPAP